MALSDQEELELLSLEREKALSGGGMSPRSPEQPRQDFNIYQRRMGLGKQGNSMETIRNAIDTAGERAGMAVTDATGSAPLGYGTNFAVNALTEIPGVVAGGEIGKLASPAFVSAARRTMQSALKPTSKALANGDASKAITTMLDEGVSATPGGAAKLRGQIDRLKGEVQDLIEQSPSSVDKGYAMSEVSKTLDKFKNQVNPDADIDAIKKSWQEFSSKWGSKIPVQQAQALKQGTQNVLRESYGRTTSSPAGEAAQKAMASGLRQGIEDAVPGVAERNANASELINALKILEPRAAQSANKDIFGLAAIPIHPEMSALMLADRNPWLKSLIAQGLYSGSERVPQTLAQIMSGIAPRLVNRPALDPYSGGALYDFPLQRGAPYGRTGGGTR